MMMTFSILSLTAGVAATALVGPVDCSSVTLDPFVPDLQDWIVLGGTPDPVQWNFLNNGLSAEYVGNNSIFTHFSYLGGVVSAAHQRIQFTITVNSPCSPCENDQWGFSIGPLTDQVIFIFDGHDPTNIGLIALRANGPDVDLSNVGAYSGFIARAQTLHATNWVPGVAYDFDVTVTPDHIVVLVNNTLEFDLSGDEFGGPLASHKFQFANLSNPTTTYTSPTFTPLDCNANGIPDCVDVTSGSGLDVNGNFVVDSCETICPGDINGDGVVNVTDLLALLGNWGVCDG